MRAALREVVGSATAYLRRFGEVIGDVVLGAIYFLLLGPLAVVLRLTRDPLRRRRPSGSAFLPWHEENDSIRQARRQG